VNVVQRAATKFTFGASDSEMTNQQWMKSGMNTFSSVLVENDDEELELLKVTKNLKTKTHGAEHAEDVAMRNLLAQFSADDLNGKFIVLNLSKSPCSSTYGTSGAKDPGCTENLIDFVKATGVNMVITCRGLYNGSKGSQDAVDALRKAGIDVSVDVRMGAQARFGEVKS
jgi:pyrimidine deaminase RibD-like protein